MHSIERVSVTHNHQITPKHGERLADSHLRMLVEESGIDPTLIDERGYFTARSRDEVPDAFSRGQRRLGLVVPMFSPDGETGSYQLRADKPMKDKRGKLSKYMTPKGVGNIIDVHPRNMRALADTSVPLWITEGVKKGDAMTTHGLCAISLAGVWSWCVPGTRGEELLGCWDHVALHGRAVYVVFDSDVMVKPEVELALERLVTALEGRGASVEVVYLPDAPDGTKTGVDDYLVAGGTVAEMYRMARPFGRDDFARTRLSRDEELRTAIEGLWAKWRDHEWRERSKARYTWRAVMRALVEEAQRSGELVPGGVRVALSQRQLAERTGTRRDTAGSALEGLEYGEGLIRREPREGKAVHESNTYILLVDTATQRGFHGNDSPSEDTSSLSRSIDSLSPPDNPALLHNGPPVSRNYCVDAWQHAALQELRRLRWGYKVRVRTDEGYEHEYVERIGKIRGEAFEILLLELGGDAHVSEVIKAMKRSDRPSQFMKRHASKLEAFGMIRVTEDRRLVVLPAWEANLGLAREMGGEYEAEKHAEERHKRDRENFKLA